MGLGATAAGAFAELLLLLGVTPPLDIGFLGIFATVTGPDTLVSAITFELELGPDMYVVPVADLGVEVGAVFSVTWLRS